MDIFHQIEDPLTGKRFQQNPELLSALREFAETLNIDSYQKLGDPENLQRLYEYLDLLQKSLVEDTIETLPEEEIPHRIKCVFLQSFLLSQLFEKTVGSKEEIQSSLKLNYCPQPWFEQIKPEDLSKSIDSLYKKFKLSPSEIEELEDQLKESKNSLQSKRNLIEILKQDLELNSDNQITRGSAKRLLDELLPFHCLKESEIDLLATATGLYFFIPSGDSLKTSPDFEDRSEEEKQNALEFVEYAHKVRFEKFTHFPMFGCFESRESKPDFLNQLASRTGQNLSHLKDSLNGVITILNSDSKNFYIIHDTWGHIWQANLTKLKVLYDDMAALRFPISPDEKVQMDDNVVSFADLLYINSKGELLYDHELAQLYIREYIKRKITALLCPISAEIGADIIEYIYQTSKDTLLPSSSLFGNQPTKTDFAWTDLQYFSKSMVKANLAYQKSKQLRSNFVLRLEQILKRKYAHHYKLIKDHEVLVKELSEVAKSFFNDLCKMEEEQLNNRFEPIDNGRGNAFTSLLGNLLKTQFQINSLFKKHLEGSHKHLWQYRIILVIFLVKNFEQNPLRNFWHLDEDIARYSLPMLELIHNSINQDQKA